MTTRLEGAETALIVGMDGIIVERKGVPAGVDLDALAVEYAALLRRTWHAASDTGLGSLQELFTVTDNSVLLVRALNEDYFLLLKLAAEANVGRARFELRRLQLLLEPEFALA